MAPELPYNLQEDSILIKIISKTPAIYNQSDEEYKNSTLKNEVWANISNKIGRPIISCKKRWRTIRDNYLKHRKKGTNNVKRHCGRKYPLVSMLTFLNYRLTSNDSEDEGTNDTNDGSDNLDDVDMDSSSLLDSFHKEQNDFQADNEVHDSKNILNSETFQMANNSNGLPAINLLGPDTSGNAFNANIIDRDKTNFLNQIVRCIEKRNNDIELLLKHVIELTKNKEADDVDLFFKSMAITTKKMTPENIAKVKLKICQIVTETEIQK